jgi:hypothetical protein
LEIVDDSPSLMYIKTESLLEVFSDIITFVIVIDDLCSTSMVLLSPTEFWLIVQLVIMILLELTAQIVDQLFVAELPVIVTPVMVIVEEVLIVVM